MPSDNPALCSPGRNIGKPSNWRFRDALVDRSWFTAYPSPTFSDSGLGDSFQISDKIHPLSSQHVSNENVTVKSLRHRRCDRQGCTGSASVVVAAIRLL